MGIRSKLLLLFIVLGFVPMLFLGYFLYREGVEAVEAELRTYAERDASEIVLRIDAELRQSETALSELARSPALRSFVSGGDRPPANIDRRNDKAGNANSDDGVLRRVLPREVKESVSAFVLSDTNRYSSITCLSTSGEPLFTAEPVRLNKSAGDKDSNTDISFKTENLLRSVSSLDARVWTTSEGSPLRSPLAVGPNGATLRYSVPVFVLDAGAGAQRGVLIVEVNSNALLDEATTEHLNPGSQSRVGSDSNIAKRIIIVLAQDGDILYHSNEVLRHQRVNSVLPTFKDVSNAMIAGESGWKSFDKDGSTWLAAYCPLAGFATSVAVAENYTEASSRVKRIGWMSFVLFSLFGLVTVIVISHVLRNTTRSIERVTEGAVAIAGGRLEQRIEVRSNDETRLLAESFNSMTDRLRDQIARESESRQFESFMRLSAMLTHDLKNAIAGLSLLVGNMGNKFHHEEFRADAMTSLTEATDKLRNLVSKLSEPVQTLSSEHQMARPTDLVPIIRKVLDTSVDPAGELHEVEVHLPESLVATVEADRIERVVENLILNALEAMGAKGGKLTVEAGETRHGEVFMSVSDTGPGISAEFQRIKLFRPFATTKKTGIGLGLFACREIIQAHGGRIEVTSSRGSGATFRAVLPSAPKTTESE